MTLHKSHFPSLLDRLQPSETAVLLGTAIIVGIGTGLGAVFFIRLIEFVQHIFFDVGSALFEDSLGRWLFILIPAIGGLLGGPIIAYFASEAKGHGVPEVMAAIALRGGRIRPRVVVAKILASALCIGSGGSAGREGPIVQVGAAIGSTIGQWLHLSEGRIRNLVACGAAICYGDHSGRIAPGRHGQRRHLIGYRSDVRAYLLGSESRIFYPTLRYEDALGDITLRLVRPAFSPGGDLLYSHTVLVRGPVR